jgi:hypothetical protein
MLCLALSGAAGLGSPTDDEDDGSFGLSKPVVCQEIDGYEDYRPMAEAAITADEKLLLYYRPRHFKSEQVGDKYRIHLKQDGSLRRKGSRAVLWTKRDMVDYEVENGFPPRHVYIRNTVSLKGLKPGDYEFEVVLHDRVGKSAPATRVVPFRVVAGPAPQPPSSPPSD